MDIDIDFADRTKILELIRHIPAMQLVDSQPQKHNTGVYVTDLPYNPLTGMANIPYDEAEERGYIKLDLLNMGIYQQIQSEEELDILLAMPAPWDRLMDEEFCKQVVHISNHYDIVCKMKPKNIEQMAMVLAIIRPAKRHLLGKSWEEIEKSIWTKPTDDTYYFKKSHAVAYAHLVLVHMNLLNL